MITTNGAKKKEKMDRSIEITQQSIIVKGLNTMFGKVSGN
jgi:hypothetical protein